MLKDTLKCLFYATGKKQIDYANYKGISKSQLGNKIRNDSFSLKDFIDLCDFLNLNITISDKNGKQIASLDKSDLET